AIMLGRLRMTVDECIDAYVSLSDRIFQKQRHRVTIKGQVQGRFDSDELERAIKEIVATQGLGEDALLKDAPDAKCKVWVKSPWVRGHGDINEWDVDSCVQQATRRAIRCSLPATARHVAANDCSV